MNIRNAILKHLQLIVNELNMLSFNFIVSVLVPRVQWIQQNSGGNLSNIIVNSVYDVCKPTAKKPVSLITK